MTVTYLIDKVNFSTFSAYVSKSEGIVNGLEAKPLKTFDFIGQHGEIVDDRRIKYKPRKIKLDMFIVASSHIDFITKAKAFVDAFKKNGRRQLVIIVDPARPLVYNVISEAEIDIEKAWSEEKMIGEFSLELIEYEPVKRLVFYSGATASITLTSQEPINIYWGDGTATKDVIGTLVVKTRTYAQSGTYYILVTGNIDDISSFTTNGSVIWQKY